MIGSENDIIEFEICIKDAFYLLHQAVDMIEPGEDHRKLLKIKKLIENNILVHERYVHSSWLKKQVQQALELLDDYADKADAMSC